MNLTRNRELEPDGTEPVEPVSQTETLELAITNNQYPTNARMGPPYIKVNVL